MCLVTDVRNGVKQMPCGTSGKNLVRRVVNVLNILYLLLPCRSYCKRHVKSVVKSCVCLEANVINDESQMPL